MGYNTVVFILNDFLDSVRNNPRQVIASLTTPRFSEAGKKDHLDEIRAVQAESGEKPMHPQALEVLPTFHSSQTKFFRAGQNCIVECEVIKTGKNKAGRRTVTLLLPEWDKENG